MSAQPVPDPRPPSIAPLELERMRGAVRATLFAKPAELPRIGRYTLLRCIGHGGMGIVYAARDEELGREVAIKLLRAELARADDRRLAEEARALARLAHPNVVCVFDVGTHDGQRFIAMEYVVGDNLRRWLAAPRTLREVLRVFASAGRGLHAAHAVGLVHRDFKPDNVLVGDDGRPRVLDFGLARPPDDASGRPPVLPTGVDLLGTALTSTGHVLGTPAYMAPEQYLGEPADARSDQFSFAVALYHAVYGERPFAGDDPQSLALSIVRGRVRPIAPRYLVPQWLDRLLARALEVDAAQRFASMQELVAVLDAQLELPMGPDNPLDALPSRDFDASRGSEAVPSTSFSLGDVALDPGAQLPMTVPTGVPATTSTSVLAHPPEAHDDGPITSLSTRRALPIALSQAALDRITRELDRLEGKRGKVVRLGAGLTWSTSALEVHVDPDRGGTQILVWRKLRGSLRRRTMAWTAFGFFCGTLAIAMTDGCGMLQGGYEVFFIISLLAFGSWQGLNRGRELHVRALPAQRGQLEFVADRLVMLARADDQSPNA